MSIGSSMAGSHWVIYYTDFLVYVLILGGIALWFINRDSVLVIRVREKMVSRSRYVVTSMILLCFITIGFLDSVHFKKESGPLLEYSLLDRLLSPQSFQTEETYSAPFASQSYVPEIITTDSGKFEEIYPRLEFAAENLTDPGQQKNWDIFYRLGKGLLLGVLISLLLFLGSRFFVNEKSRKKVQAQEKTRIKENIKEKGLPRALTSFWLTLGIIICLVSMTAFVMFDYHILGTDKVGRDVFYITIKSIRTGLIIGSVTTLVMLPFALLFGMMAGYFPGWIDDTIQYVYITLSSIPAILLIAAAVVSLQIKIEANPDLKLLLLCMILGLTSWTSLCRYVRAETLKLRETEFVQAAITLGANKANILWRHILPNLMHIVIITLVLDFSGLVLAEAVLTYVGVGVDATTYSWGNMINAARLEMARDPIVWWSLTGSLVMMFTLVFSANVFSEAIQEALSPRRE